MVQIKTQKTAQERKTILVSEGSQLFSNTKCLRNNIFQTFRQPMTSDARLTLTNTFVCFYSGTFGCTCKCNNMM